MLTISSDGTVKILSGNLTDRASQISLTGTGLNNECLVVSPDERVAAVGTNGGGLLFLELENRGNVIHQNTEQGKIVLFLENLGNSGNFVSAGTANSILTWKYSSYEATELVSTSARPSALAASTDGSKVAYGTRDGKLYELNVSNPGSVRQLTDFGRNHVRAITYSPGGQYLVAGLLDGSIRVLAGEGRSSIATLTGPGARVTDLDYSPDGRFLAAGSHDGNVYLWCSADWNNPPLVFSENNGFVLAVCFSRNSGYFYSGSVDYPRLIGRPSEAARMANDFCSLVGRNLTQAEWDQYFGGEIPYQKTCTGIN
jgi:WD40 repeat protein